MLGNESVGRGKNKQALQMFTMDGCLVSLIDNIKKQMLGSIRNSFIYTFGSLGIYLELWIIGDLFGTLDHWGFIWKFGLQTLSWPFAIIHHQLQKLIHLPGKVNLTFGRRKLSFRMAVFQGAAPLKLMMEQEKNKTLYTSYKKET